MPAGAEVAWRQDQCNRIAQELVVRLQSGLQGLTVEEVLAAAMVKVRCCNLPALIVI